MTAMTQCVVALPTAIQYELWHRSVYELLFLRSVDQRRTRVRALNISATLPHVPYLTENPSLRARSRELGRTFAIVHFVIP